VPEDVAVDLSVVGTVKVHNTEVVVFDSVQDWATLQVETRKKKRKTFLVSFLTLFCMSRVRSLISRLFEGCFAPAFACALTRCTR
jgi:hypothetical protein